MTLSSPHHRGQSLSVQGVDKLAMPLRPKVSFEDVPELLALGVQRKQGLLLVVESEELLDSVRGTTTPLSWTLTRLAVASDQATARSSLGQQRLLSLDTQQLD